MPVKFFWDRMHRAMQMDMANKLSGRPTHFWIQADEWTGAYKKTLSGKQQKEFDKEYAKLEAEYDTFLRSKHSV